MGLEAPRSGAISRERVRGGVYGSPDRLDLGPFFQLRSRVGSEGLCIKRAPWRGWTNLRMPSGKGHIHGEKDQRRRNSWEDQLSEGGGRWRRTARERQRIRISITIDSCIIKKGDVNLKSFFYLINNASPILSHLLRPFLLPFPFCSLTPESSALFFHPPSFPRIEL